jgi:RimJ/RimL family protein N-acetyltransferase
MFEPAGVVWFTGQLAPMKLRLANFDDSARLLRWRNDPATIAMSRAAKPVDRQDHEQWLRSTIADNQRVLLLAIENKEPVGTVRLDHTANDEWKVSITVGPESRGLGLGTLMLRHAAEHAVTTLGARILVAEVKEGNMASRQLFERAGYQFVGVKDDFRRYKLCG